MLIVDCSTAHLDKHSVFHLRRLGFLVVFIPAKMTWLLQILDVFVFGKVKRAFREAEARARSASLTGHVAPGTWMKIATTVLRREIINCDWSEAFSRLGAGESCLNLSGPVAQLAAGQDLSPALPTRAEFALLINRPPDSTVTRALHASIIGHTLAVQRLPVNAEPPHSATYDLPVSRHARAPSSRRRSYEYMEPTAVANWFAEDVTDEPTFLHPFQPARNVQLDLGPDAGD